LGTRSPIILPTSSTPLPQVAAVALLALALSPSVSAQSQSTIRHSVLSLTASKDIAEPRAWVLRNEAQWKSFLAETVGHSGSAPQVDFSRQTVIGIFAGQKNTGGYSIRILRITARTEKGKPSSATVHYRVAAPPADGMVTQALTYPYTILRVDGKPEKLEFDPPLPISP